MRLSLQRRIALLWATLFCLIAGLGFIMWGLYQNQAHEQAAERTARLEQATDELSQRYQRYRSTFPQGINLDDSTVSSELGLIDNVVLKDYDGIEGGLWRAKKGSLIYAFPTHDGDVPKQDVPAAELNQIEATIGQAYQLRGTKTTVVPGSHDILLLHAESIPGGESDVVAWTMARVPLAQADSYRQFLLGLLILTLIPIGSGAWLLLSLRRWSSRVGDVERTVLKAPSEDAIPELPLTGEKELDRLILTFNRIKAQLTTSEQTRADLSRHLARAERLAGLGRMTAGLAHELGNPIGAMRLRLDNALDGDAERQRSALVALDGQVRRLEDLLQRLFFLGKISQLQVTLIEVEPWMKQLVENIKPHAQNQQVGLKWRIDSPFSCRMDPTILGRALENLILNAIQHSPSQSEVNLDVSHDEKTIVFQVVDQGPGVAPEDRERIFEPFVSQRTDGTGLGLTLVQEAANAHGGAVRLAPSHSGSTFILEIPWQKS